MYAPLGWFLPVNWIDLILLVVLALFGLRGFFRGLFREIFSLMGFVTGYMMAVAYDEPLAAVGAAYWNVSSLILKGAAFVAIFFLVYFSFNLIGSLLHRSEKLLFLQTVNRAGGVVIGVGKGAALTALVLFYMSSTSWLSQPTRDKIESAYLVSPLSQLAERIVRIGKERIFLPERRAVRSLSLVSPV